MILRTIILLFLFSATTSFAQIQSNRKYIYSEKWDMGGPNGYFGAANGSGMKIIHNYDQNPFAGKKCVRIKTNGKEAWAGFLTLNAGKWKAELNGDKTNLANLSDYEKLIIHVRAEKNTKITLSFGENTEPHTSLTNIAISKEWTKISMPLANLDLSAINGLFGITLMGADTVYLDEIYLEAKPGVKILDKKNNITTSIELKPIKVTLQKKSEDNFVLLRGNKPYYAKGAGGSSYLDRIKNYGGNSLRTWSHDNARAILDSAHKYGLTVLMGLWVQHERHGFDYNDKEAVYYQTQAFKDAVLELKDHPALLAWGIGNEVDLFYSNTNVWYAIQDIAKMIHEIDPNHPTTTITAGLDPEEIRLINERCPDIDFMSINTYGDLENVVPLGIRKAGWKGAYMITEWGPTGHWEIASTDFKIPIEQTSREKSIVYKERYTKIAADSSKCIGSYVFLWGNKQETTPTWYSMFLENGSESEVIDIMQYNWSKKWPSNKAPTIQEFNINGKKALDNIYVTAGSINTSDALFTDPEKKVLKLEWVFMPESTDKKAGGDFEKTPEVLTNLIIENKNFSIKFKAPSNPGAYRLYVYAYDEDNNVAFGNIPFYVNAVK